MTPKRVLPLLGLVVGILFTLAPVVGLLASAFLVSGAFKDVGNAGIADPRDISNRLETSTFVMAGGFGLFVIGLAFGDVFDHCPYQAPTSCSDITGSGFACERLVPAGLKVGAPRHFVDPVLRSHVLCRRSCVTTHRERVGEKQKRLVVLVTRVSARRARVSRSRE